MSIGAFRLQGTSMSFSRKWTLTRRTFSGVSSLLGCANGRGVAMESTGTLGTDKRNGGRQGRTPHKQRAALAQESCLPRRSRERGERPAKAGRVQTELLRLRKKSQSTPERV